MCHIARTNPWLSVPRKIHRTEMVPKHSPEWFTMVFMRTPWWQGRATAVSRVGKVMISWCRISKWLVMISLCRCCIMLITGWSTRTAHLGAASRDWNKQAMMGIWARNLSMWSTKVASLRPAQTLLEAPALFPKAVWQQMLRARVVFWTDITRWTGSWCLASTVYRAWHKATREMKYCQTICRTPRATRTTLMEIKTTPRLGMVRVLIWGS